MKCEAPEFRSWWWLIPGADWECLFCRIPSLHTCSCCMALLLVLLSLDFYADRRWRSLAVMVWDLVLLSVEGGISSSPGLDVGAGSFSSLQINLKNRLVVGCWWGGRLYVFLLVFGRPRVGRGRGVTSSKQLRVRHWDSSMWYENWQWIMMRLLGRQQLQW